MNNKEKNTIEKANKYIMSITGFDTGVSYCTSIDSFKKARVLKKRAKSFVIAGDGSESLLVFLNSNNRSTSLSATRVNELNINQLAFIKMVVDYIAPNNTELHQHINSLK